MGPAKANPLLRETPFSFSLLGNREGVPDE